MTALAILAALGPLTGPAAAIAGARARLAGIAQAAGAAIALGCSLALLVMLDGRAPLFAWAESPRGEALAWVALDQDGRITRARLRPGSARNWRGFDDACRSQNVFTDIPIIEASFWLTVAGMAW